MGGMYYVAIVIYTDTRKKTVLIIKQMGLNIKY